MGNGPASIHMERYQPTPLNQNTPMKQLPTLNESISKRSYTTRKTKLSKSINPSYASNVSNI
jgi:hypothetical protein